MNNLNIRKVAWIWPTIYDLYEHERRIMHWEGEFMTGATQIWIVILNDRHKFCHSPSQCVWRGDGSLPSTPMSWPLYNYFKCKYLQQFQYIFFTWTIPPSFTDYNCTVWESGFKIIGKTQNARDWHSSVYCLQQVSKWFGHIKPNSAHHADLSEYGPSPEQPVYCAGPSGSCSSE